ncbi:MAG: methyltransferase domain-containing protein [Desulfobacterales bacterium]|jgi:phospholipid N-methyltransferase|nr:methyltransferase domain-containing protein [Desulfobacterales bacterium]
MDEKKTSHQNPFRLNGRFAFFKGFLRHPSAVGSIIPSSRFLERRLVDIGGIARRRMVVELGPGTGGTTLALLNALPRSSRLLAVEVNPEFFARLQTIADPRLEVHLGSAEHIGQALAQHGWQRPDAVVSGIPFSNMPAECGRRILRAIWACLAPGGCFVAYQFMKRVAELAHETLGPPAVALEFLNVPPVRVYCWQKPIAAASGDTAHRSADGRPSAQAVFAADPPPG